MVVVPCIGMPDPPRATVLIVGTSHIAVHSVREVEEAFAAFKPDVIAVELDVRRLAGLEQGPQRDRRVPLRLAKEIGVTGWMFLAIGGWLQRKLGGAVRMEPGIDMLTAVRIAKEKKLLLSLVDRDILITLRRLSKSFTWKERWRIVWDVIRSPFSREKVAIRLDKVPDSKTIVKLLGMMKHRYPSLYRVLVTERNEFMANRIVATTLQRPGARIMLVIGAGHADDVAKRLSVVPGIAVERRGG